MSARPGGAWDDFVAAAYKRAIAVGGFLLALPGVPMAIGVCCLLGSVDGSMAVMTLATLTLGAGGVAFWCSTQSLRGRPSRPLQLPHPLVVAVAVLLALLGLAYARVFSPFLLAAAVLAPLMGAMWLAEPATAAATGAQAGPLLTRRRGLVAMAGGATVSLVIAVAAQALVASVVMALVLGLNDRVGESLSAMHDAFVRVNLVAVFSGNGFLYVLVHLAVLAPLVSELAKPLIALPLLRRWPRPQAFATGALIGAGFAAAETALGAALLLILFRDADARMFPGVLGFVMVRMLGGAIHPLCTGLVTLGWRDVMIGGRGRAGIWLRRYGSAVAIQAVWNVAAMLVVALIWLGAGRAAGAGFDLFASQEWQLQLAAGVLVLGFVVVTTGALWAGRRVAQELALHPLEREPEREPVPGGITLTNEVIAIGAVACLTVIAPAGIVLLRLLAGWSCCG